MTSAKRIDDPYVAWITEGLKLPGKSQSGLARHLGLHPSAINKVVSSKRGLSSTEIVGAAEYLGIPAPGPIEARGAGGVRAVPIVGIAEAGTFREVDDTDQSEPRTIDLPTDSMFPNARQFAVEVSGESMNALKPRPILPGDVVVCVSYEDVADQVVLRDGMVVVVERTRDGGLTREWSVKQIELYADRTEFHPRSTNPRHKPIVIARDMHADAGVSVEIIGLARGTFNPIPLS